MTRLEARILAMHCPKPRCHCEEFEEYLTDYLDGFLPAQVFHRWERHAVLCDDCTTCPEWSSARSRLGIVQNRTNLPFRPACMNGFCSMTIGTARAKAVEGLVR